MDQFSLGGGQFAVLIRYTGVSPNEKAPHCGAFSLGVELIQGKLKAR
jgi:hypothetical protein